MSLLHFRMLRMASFMATCLVSGRPKESRSGARSSFPRRLNKRDFEAVNNSHLGTFIQHYQPRRLLQPCRRVSSFCRLDSPDISAILYIDLFITICTVWRPPLSRHPYYLLHLLPVVLDKSTLLVKKNGGNRQRSSV